MTSSKRTVAVLLAAVLVLSLLLTACGKSGDTPDRDNATLGVAETPDTTTEPPSDPDSGTSEPPLDLSAYPKPNWATDYDDATVAGYDNEINELRGWSQYGGIDSVIEEAYQKYAEYLHEYLTEDVVRDAIKSTILIDWIPQLPTKNDNPANITPVAFDKVNDFLKDNGEEPLTDIQDPHQSIAALWLAINLNYNPENAKWYNDVFVPDLPDDPYIRDFKNAMDLSMAVALAKCSDTTNLLDGEVQNYMDWFIASYRAMFPSLRPH